MLVTPSQIALYAIAGLFALYLWVRVFTFPHGKRRLAVEVASIFTGLMVLIVGVFSFLLPWVFALVFHHPFTALL